MQIQQTWQILQDDFIRTVVHQLLLNYLFFVRHQSIVVKKSCFKFHPIL